MTLEYLDFDFYEINLADLIFKLINATQVYIDNMFLKKIYFYKKYNHYLEYSKDKKKIIKLKKLKKIVDRAYNNVLFYRSYWDSKNFSPSDLENLKDIKKIPKINRRIVEETYEDFFSLNTDKEDFSQLVFEETSGSLSESLKIPWGENAIDYKDMVYYRTLKTLNYSVGDKIIYYWPKEGEESSSGVLDLFNKKYIRPNRSLKAQLRRIAKLKPRYVYYFPVALLFISNLIINKRIDLNYSPKMIITQGELMTPGMRRRISKAFNAPVVDLYATREFGIIATKFRNKYIVNSDFVLLEEDGGTEKRKVLLTSLVKESFPIIRYDIGDVISTEGSKGDTLEDFQELFGKEIFIKKFRDRGIDIIDLIDSLLEIEGIYKFCFNMIDNNIRLDLETFDPHEKIRERIGRNISSDLTLNFRNDLDLFKNGKFPLIK